MRILLSALGVGLLILGLARVGDAQAAQLEPAGKAAIQKSVSFSQRSLRPDLGPEDRAMVAEAFRTRAALEDSTGPGRGPATMGTLKAQAQQLKSLVAERRRAARGSTQSGIGELTRLEAALDQTVSEIEAIDALPVGSAQRNQRLDGLVQTHRRPKIAPRPGWSPRLSDRGKPSGVTTSNSSSRKTNGK